MRLDKFLKVSRLIKRRTVANEACDAGRVSVNGKPAKASVQVKPGDVIELHCFEVLDKDGELRRYLTIGEVQETERGWQFYVTFDHQRVDHKELYVLVPKNQEDLETSYVVRLELMD